MAKAGLRILGDESESARLGRRGRDIAVSRFATEKIIPQYEDLYRRVIAEKSERNP
jgi:glycosyltransferase involved in cell wall biosynthesis